MVRIRLRRMGPRSRPTYRVVIIDSRKARDGKYLEAVGDYDPRTKLLNLDQPRIAHWLSKGARPSDTVKRLYGRVLRRQPVSVEPVANTTEPEPAAEPPEPTETAS